MKGNSISTPELRESAPAPGLAVAILAAGKSRRMGGSPKLCLPWPGCGGTILGHALDTWASLGASRIIVVHGPASPEPSAAPNPVEAEISRLLSLRPELRQIVTGIATRWPERDMMGSVQTAASYLTSALFPSPSFPSSHLFIALGDQPHLRLATLLRLTHAATDLEHRGAILKPRYEGCGGHPIGIPFALFPWLATSDAPTLKHFLQDCHVPTADIACDDPGLLLDIDTPADYDDSLRIAGFSRPQIRNT